MNAEQRGLARHALGLPNRRKISYRNHFVAGIEHHDFAAWQEMVAANEAIRRNPSPITGGDYCFQLTKLGATGALNNGEALDAEDFG
jgi:hypothetical protein